MTVHPIRQPVAEQYVTRAELAALMAVSIRTIDKFRTEGMPSRVFGRSRRFLPSQAIAWAIAENEAA